MTFITNTPEPPYVAVIFTSIYHAVDGDGYAQTADEMARLAALQDGYLGDESARDAEGNGVTISYWRDEESVKKWKEVGAHKAAQRAGRKKWYKAYKARVATVTRDYGMGL